MFVVAGSSGQTGSVVADTLLRRGEQVRLIVREPARSSEGVSAFEARGAEVFVADLSDADSLTDALQGAKGVFLLVPPNMTAPDLLGLHRTLIASMGEAVRRSQPDHVVGLSSVGAHLSAGTGPVESLRLFESTLRQVSQNVTFVRPAFFMESLGSSLAGLAGGVFPTFLRADLSVALVATKDIGRVVADALLGGPRGPRVIELEGPRRYTAIEAASELSGLVSQPIRVQEIPESAIVAAALSFGMSQQVAELSHELFHALNSGHLSFELDESERVHGTTLVHEVFGKLLANTPGTSA